MMNLGKGGTPESQTKGGTLLTLSCRSAGGVKVPPWVRGLREVLGIALASER